MLRTRSSLVATQLPTMKNVPFTPRWFSASTTWGVQV